MEIWGKSEENEENSRWANFDNLAHLLVSCLVVLLFWVVQENPYKTPVHQPTPRAECPLIKQQKVVIFPIKTHPQSKVLPNTTA